jgi:hypothetical protein
MKNLGFKFFGMQKIFRSVSQQFSVDKFGGQSKTRGRTTRRQTRKPFLLNGSNNFRRRSDNDNDNDRRACQGMIALHH